VSGEREKGRGKRGKGQGARGEGQGVDYDDCKNTVSYLFTASRGRTSGSNHHSFLDKYYSDASWGVTRSSARTLGHHLGSEW
jgi:hypothetical protein